MRNRLLSLLIGDRFQLSDKLRHSLGRSQIQCVLMAVAHILDGERIAVTEHFANPLSPRAGHPAAVHAMREIVRRDAIVGRADPASIGIVERRHLLERDEALPLVLRIPPASERSFVATSHWDAAGRLEADVTVDVSNDQCKRRYVPRSKCLAKFGHCCRAIDAQQRSQPASLRHSEPPQRNGSEFIGGSRQNFIDDRPISRKPDCLRDRVAVADGNRFGQFASGFPLTVEFEASRMFVADAFLVEVSLRADVVCDSPGDFLIPAEHDGWHPGISHAGNIERPAAQMSFVPARNRFERDVRVAGQQRCSRRRFPAGDDPVIAAGRGVRIGN